VQIDRLDCENLEDESLDALAQVDGILVAPGFGARGVAGKLKAIEYARTRGIPFLGICFGMQLALIEFARNVCGLKAAMTTEVDPATPDPVVDFLPDQREIARLGGSMRLGAYACTLEAGTLE
jgi:CTP synthase